VFRIDKLTTFTYRLSRSLGASTSWNPQSLSRPIQKLLYLYLYALGRQIGLTRLVQDLIPVHCVALRLEGGLIGPSLLLLDPYRQSTINEVTFFPFLMHSPFDATQSKSWVSNPRSAGLTRSILLYFAACCHTCKLCVYYKSHTII